MAQTKNVRVTELRTGMVLDIGKKGVRIKSLSPCKHKRHGVPKVHVNDRFCYDTAGYADIRITDNATENAPTV